MFKMGWLDSGKVYDGYFSDIGNGSISWQQIVSWAVDAGLQTLGKPFTVTNNTDLTSAEWEEIIRIGLIAGPQFANQFGVTVTLTRLLLENNLHMRMYWESDDTTQPPPITNYTNQEVLAFIVDKALQDSDLPKTPSTSTDLTPAEWSNVITMAMSSGPQIISQYNSDLVLTESLIQWNLHMRNYWEGADTTQPPTTKPNSTVAQMIGWSVDAVLDYYGYDRSSPTKAYISDSRWADMIQRAFIAYQQLEELYNVSGGMTGLGDDYMQYKILGNLHLGNLSDATCWDSFGNTKPCGSSDDAGWGTKWGPTILSLLGTTLSLIGTTWQASQLRNQANTAYYQSTGTTLGVGTTRDAELLAQQIQTQTGMSYSQAYEKARILLGLPAKEEPDFTKYLLPFGIAVGAYLLLSRRS